jgi:hypothetical protein
MFMLRFMQGFSIFLWFCLAFGLYSAFREGFHAVTFFQIIVNLLFQFGVRRAIRDRKNRLALVRRG